MSERWTKPPTQDKSVMTYIKSEPEAQAIAAQCAKEDRDFDMPKWSYNVRRRGPGWIVQVYDEAGHYLGTL